MRSSPIPATGCGSSWKSRGSTSRRSPPVRRSNYSSRWSVPRQAGETAEVARIDRVYTSYKEAYLRLRGSYFEMGSIAGEPKVSKEAAGQSRGVYYEAIAIPTLGLEPHIELYQILADL